MAVPDPQPMSAPPSEEPKRRWRDHSFLPPLFKDVGILLGVVSMLGAALYTVVETRARNAYSEKVTEDFRQEIRDLRQENQEMEEKLEEKVKLLPAMEQWVACREKEAKTGRRHNFYWTAVECTPDEGPSKSAPPGSPSQP